MRPLKLLKITSRVAGIIGIKVYWLSYKVTVQLNQYPNCNIVVKNRWPPIICAAVRCYGCKRVDENRRRRRYEIMIIEIVECTQVLFCIF